MGYRFVFVEVVGSFPSNFVEAIILWDNECNGLHVFGFAIGMTIGESADQLIVIVLTKTRFTPNFPRNVNI